MPMNIKVESSAFPEGGPIPRKYTGEGRDVSPPLSWDGLPTQTVSVAILCDDPDAPRATPWVHWVLADLPADLHHLDEGESDVGVKGRNDFGHNGYGGPMPPPGHGVHHYHFHVYALDRKTGLSPGATKDALLSRIEGHVLAQGDLVGTYERKK
jgi:Raf kinase inhibitor-like YbhB/YbcL family protein